MRAEPQLPVVRAPERLGFWTNKERLDEPPADGGARRSYEFDGRDGAVGAIMVAGLGWYQKSPATCAPP